MYSPFFLFENYNLKLLLLHGADPSPQDDSGNSPLHSCAEVGDTGKNK